MSRILIAYATNEGQTGRIATALADQLEQLGHAVERAPLGRKATGPDPTAYDAAIVAASVHAGRHQKHALRYVRHFRAALGQRPAAFVSVSGLAAATRPAGQEEAAKQVEAFLTAAEWHPPLVERVAGALRPSQLSWFLRLVLSQMRKFARKELERLGWPAMGPDDQEFTDWAALRRFGERFAETLPDAPGRAARRA